MDRFLQWEQKLGQQCVYIPRIHNNLQIDIKTQRSQKLQEYKNLQNTKKDEEERVDIMKDISRTYQELELFQLEENKSIMCNVLMVWCSTSLSYRQGMNEIMGVIFYTYKESHPQITNSEEAESDLYWVLQGIMDGGSHREMFNYSANTKIDNTPIIKRIKEITSKLHDIDPELYEIFQQNQISTEIFLMRWLKCLLAREFEITQIQHIWDCLFCYFKRNQLEFVDSIILAMMINLKQKMLQIEYINNFEVLLLFQNFPSKDQYKEILTEAIKIYKQLQKIAFKRENQLKEFIKSFSLTYTITKIIRYLFSCK